MVDKHLRKDSSAVVGDGDVAIGRNKDLIETTRTERSAHNTSNRLCGENVRFDGLVSVLSLLLTLVSYDNERAAVLIFGDLG